MPLAAFSGVLLNMTFLLPGAVSSIPVLVLLDMPAHTWMP